MQDRYDRISTRLARMTTLDWLQRWLPAGRELLAAYKAQAENVGKELLAERSLRAALEAKVNGHSDAVKQESLDAFRKGERFILCSLICSSNLLSTPITIIDAGALNCLTDPRWTKLPADKVCLHGFEPDEKECARLNEVAKSSGLDFHFHPTALAGRTGSAEFFRYAEPSGNSFYPPNEPLIQRWCYRRSQPFASLFALQERSVIEVLSLSDWSKAAGITDIDFIKLNVQGAELDVLSGAGGLIDQTIGLLVEQTFTPTYIGAPMFGRVYDFIENSGFCMFDIVGGNRLARLRSPVHLHEDRIFTLNAVWPHHQFFEGHFFYLRDPLRAGDVWGENNGLALEKCLKLACVAEIFGQIEFAFEILDWIAYSPQAAPMAASITKVIEDGTLLYREASAQANAAPGAPDPDELVPAAMRTSFTTIAEDEQSRMRLEMRRLRAELRAANLENNHLQAFLEARNRNGSPGCALRR